jgi:hypothetical protein
MRMMQPSLVGNNTACACVSNVGCYSIHRRWDAIVILKLLSQYIGGIVVLKFLLGLGTTDVAVCIGGR